MHLLPRTEPAYVATIDHVRELVLVGSAAPWVWRGRLRGEGLAPQVVDGRARVLLSATDLHFAGIRFREVTLSVLVSRDREGRSEDGAYLLLAYNSSRLLALCERRLFLTPYVHATIDLAIEPPASLVVADGDGVVLTARAGASMRAPARTIAESFGGPVFLPHPGRPREVFYARVDGQSRAYPFDPKVDSFVVHPRAATPALAWLADSDFQAIEWRVRDDASHAKSRTFEWGDTWPPRAGHGAPALSSP